MICFALDFDGVLCDSAGETGLTGWRAARTIWRALSPRPPADYVARFRRVRPILETGYQSIILARLLSRGVEPERIVETFPACQHEVLADTGLDVPGLVARFGAARDEWRRRDPDGWLRAHRFYPGVEPALRRAAAARAAAIISTKQRRFLRALLAAAGIEFPDAALFGLEDGRKNAVLAGLVTRAAPGTTWCFVEDRLPTLLRVAADPALSKVALYVARWGYCTDREAAAAAGTPGIEVIGLGAFTEALAGMTRPAADGGPP